MPKKNKQEAKSSNEIKVQLGGVTKIQIDFELVKALGIPRANRDPQNQNKWYVLAESTPAQCTD